MKTFKVTQFRFNDGKTRIVEVPTSYPSETTEVILNSVFHFGQNDFQPKDSPSVSVGDVIEVGNEKHIVKNFGFEKITDEFFNTLKEVSDSTSDLSFKTTYRNLLWEKLGDKSFDYC